MSIDRITLVISSLGGGGAERVASNMANYWAAEGRKVTILTLGHGIHPPAYDLHRDVAHRDLAFSKQHKPLAHDAESLRALQQVFQDCTGIERKIFINKLSLIVALRRALLETDPHIVISYLNLTNVLVLLATQNLHLPVIVTEHCAPNAVFIARGWQALRQRLYPRARCVVTLTEEAMRYFSATAGTVCRVIPNAVLPPDCEDSETISRDKSGKTLIAMGRFYQEKGFDQLLYVFASLAREHSEWSLQIWGEGPLRAEIEGLARRFGLGRRVLLPGFTNRPYDALRRADLFVLSSYHEGFPNVLLEAMACGLPVVSYDCDNGPRHIIRDGVDGVLVRPQTAQALAQALDRLMSDQSERERLARAAPEVLERFGIEKVMGMWEQVLSREKRKKIHKVVSGSVM